MIICMLGGTFWMTGGVSVQVRLGYQPPLSRIQWCVTDKQFQLLFLSGKVQPASEEFPLTVWDKNIYSPSDFQILS